MGDDAKMIRKILFPVDFSDSCVAMAVYVKRFSTFTLVTLKCNQDRT